MTELTTGLALFGPATVIGAAWFLSTKISRLETLSQATVERLSRVESELKDARGTRDRLVMLEAVCRSRHDTKGIRETGPREAVPRREPTQPGV